MEKHSPPLGPSPAVGAIEARADVIDELREADAALARSAAARLRAIRDVVLADERAREALGESADSGASGGGRVSGVRFRDPGELAMRALRAEVAAALRIAESTAQALIAASRMIDDLPATFAALEAGTISERHARVLHDETLDLDAESRAQIERLALPRAMTATPGALRRRLRDARARLTGETALERHEIARESRGVWLDGAPDGMAQLSAILPAVEAHAVYDRLCETARGMRDDPLETRTIAQLRADVLADLLLAIDAGPRSRIRPTVHLTVPVLTLLGHGEEPAILDGYGPIDIDTARELAADAPSLVRVLTDPESGAVLSMGTKKYRPDADLRAWLRMRDGTCRFPTCSQPARRCDLDHTRDWAALDGPTDHDNLAHLCRGHHTLKHHTDWRVRQVDDIGTLEWTSPRGHVYLDEPAVRIRPAPAVARLLGEVGSDPPLEAA